MQSICLPSENNRPNNDTGTSRFTIRCASPWEESINNRMGHEGINVLRTSTTAVFPTPGSPMRTGLFFVLLQRIRTTRRISSSRPMTGSIFPSAARAVRSTAYLDRASKPCSAFLVSTRRFPRIWSMAVLRVASVRPASFTTVWMLGSFMRARSRWS